MRDRVRLGLAVAVLLVASVAVGLPAPPSLSFTVSMPRPTTHMLHVELRCEGLGGRSHDFKLPVWTPGYYRIMDFAKHVVDFSAADGAGRPLGWEKVAKSTWRVATEGAPVVVLIYDVYAFERSVANSFLDDSRALVSPAATFMYPADSLRLPVTVTIRPPEGWHRISTGLDQVEGRPGAFSAPDFDVLYDCPILVGNQEVYSFEVQGVPHFVALDGIGTLDRPAFVADLKRIVESAVGLMGDIPYRHYTFIALGKGYGGLEHASSTLLHFNDPSPRGGADYTRWLAFIAHEYFHLFNVKAIRPVELGPFDYDRENHTSLLWMSEGFTVFYEDRVLRRAGLLSPELLLRRAAELIARVENSPGHRHQSVAQASVDTWLHFLDRGEDAVNTTISYYDKGAALAMLLDLEIRHSTGNARSLDDVMRTLYRTFYLEKRRGFSEAELRAVCDKTAGTSLAEIFEGYVRSTQEIDYARHFAHAGLAVDLEPKAVPGGYLGAETEVRDGALVVVGLNWDGPARDAGLAVDDEVLALDGARVTAASLAEALKAHASSDTVRLLVSRRSRVQEVEVRLGSKAERSFTLTPVPSPSPLQKAILGAWLEGR